MEQPSIKPPENKVCMDVLSKYLPQSSNINAAGDTSNNSEESTKQMNGNSNISSTVKPYCYNIRDLAEERNDISQNSLDGSKDRMGFNYSLDGSKDRMGFNYSLDGSKDRMGFNYSLDGSNDRMGLNHSLFEQEFAKMSDTAKKNKIYEYGKNIVPFIQPEKQYIKFVDASTVHLTDNQNNPHISSRAYENTSNIGKVQQFFTNILGSNTGKIQLDSDAEIDSDEETGGYNANSPKPQQAYTSPSNKQPEYSASSVNFDSYPIESYSSSAKDFEFEAGRTRRSLDYTPNLDRYSSFGQAAQTPSSTCTGFGNSKVSPQGFGNSKLSTQGFGNSKLSTQGFGNSKLSTQGFGNSKFSSNSQTQHSNWDSLSDFIGNAKNATGWSVTKSKHVEHREWDKIMSGLQQTNIDTTHDSHDDDCNRQSLDSSQYTSDLITTGIEPKDSAFAPTKTKHPNSLKKVLKQRENPYLRKHFKLDNYNGGTSYDEIEEAYQDQQSRALSSNTIPQNKSKFDKYSQDFKSLQASFTESASSKFNDIFSKNKSGASITKLTFEKANNMYQGAKNILPWSQNIKLGDSNQSQNQGISGHPNQFSNKNDLDDPTIHNKSSISDYTFGFNRFISQNPAQSFFKTKNSTNHQLNTTDDEEYGHSDFTASARRASAYDTNWNDQDKSDYPEDYTSGNKFKSRFSTGDVQARGKFPQLEHSIWQPSPKPENLDSVADNTISTPSNNDFSDTQNDRPIYTDNLDLEMLDFIKDSDLSPQTSNNLPLKKNINLVNDKEFDKLVESNPWK
ncbi:hypothetical protein BB561_005179 [Smittium simulii]|uniref:Uncharacterized protein n=1 Tax=Smittium simulii TaxID=133385 RepID=A0A2T9YBM2_9FUNG|nr:hypothetical protein BB561_005179 [Smittium simulii]